MAKDTKVKQPTVAQGEYVQLTSIINDFFYMTIRGCHVLLKSAGVCLVTSPQWVQRVWGSGLTSVDMEHKQNKSILF